MLGELYPDVYKSFFDSRGRLYVQLDKDLYGCVESAKLFYDHLSKSLTSMGFAKNPYGHCVFNCVMYDKQCTVTVHVDGLKISCADRRGVADTVNCLKRIYKRLNCHKEKVLDYLGMDFDYRSPGQVKSSMVGMVDEALDEYELEGSAKTPAALHLFQVSEDSPALKKGDKEKFHSMVQKLLYMSKRARPDILTAVSFLTTRVTSPTEEA